MQLDIKPAQYLVWTRYCAGFRTVSAVQCCPCLSLEDTLQFRKSFHRKIGH